MLPPYLLLFWFVLCDECIAPWLEAGALGA